MKPHADADPGCAREFEVLAIVILLALAGAALSDFLNQPTWSTLVEASAPANPGDRNGGDGVLIEPWIPH